MTHLEHYLRVHLAGAAAGIDLFERVSSSLQDPSAREALAGVPDQLREERAALLGFADGIGTSENTLLTVGARVGERLRLLKPNGSLVHRTPLTDLVDLEAMSTAVSGKICGFQALLTVADDVPALDRALLEQLLEQADGQRDLILRLHREAAARALSPG